MYLQVKRALKAFSFIFSKIVYTSKIYLKKYIYLKCLALALGRV